MLPLSPALLLAAASALADDDAANARRFTPLGFVHHAGWWSHWDHRSARSAWPISAMASGDQLAEFARRHRILVTDCLPGDVFVAWSPAEECYAAAGIVCAIVGVAHPPLRTIGVSVDCAVIECVSMDGASAPRRRVRRLRPAAGDRFVRWPELDARAMLDRAIATTRTLRRAA